jgi:tRNA (guanine9-N1)-methyltransferase
LTRMESMNNAAYRRWTGTEWWQEGYERVWSGKKGDSGSDELKDVHRGSRVKQQDVIYLTADSDEELMELKDDEMYIIGGICDHNRYKVRHAHTACVFTDDTHRIFA